MALPVNISLSIKIKQWNNLQKCFNIILDLVEKIFLNYDNRFHDLQVPPFELLILVYPTFSTSQEKRKKDIYTDT